MKRLIAASLLFVSFNCFASVFEDNQDPYIDLARLPVLVHFCDKADAAEKADIKEYIATAIFGATWEDRLSIAKEAVAQDIFGALPPPAFSLVQVNVCMKAEKEGRQDVLDFLRDNAVFKERKFNINKGTLASSQGLTPSLGMKF